MAETDFTDPGQVRLRGALLLAEPALQDENFCRSVVLLTEHDPEQGAHGFILNRPYERGTVGDLLSDPQFAEVAEVPVFLGGPVSQEKLTFASLAWDEAKQRLHYQTHLSVAQAARAVAEGVKVLAFVGYSGWAAGQLEKELKRRSWIVRRPEARCAEGIAGLELWSQLLREMGPYFDLLSRLPEDLSLN